MTPAAELTPRWPNHPESHNPHDSIFLRVDNAIYVGPTEMTHKNLEKIARSAGFPEVSSYTDAGEIFNRPDGSLQIREYHQTQVSIRHFHGEFSSAEEMLNKFDEVRKFTASLICQKTGKVVWVELHTKELFEVSF